ncbi:hypothetical protein Lepto7376_2535 [[Leptolyngbya] sp. PCC 7376]|uniref:hypothetical protein n=1 Tax=[Leptolyngbya] sp. PCC 7376 TaxID=111781 RepID=UPI00029F4491|nr:hypothetical protein [[Leptolyngbya] sp. PCC 7376]AFY38809.1 hypothetical protein Lepto7376_2535 [[Leptolyngbya] sp. PCC 7376]
MGLSLVVDIAIGLIFIYLILSLLASEVQEVITTIMQWRAKHLKESIETLISGTTDPDDPTLSEEQKQVLLQAREKGQRLAGILYKHPLVNSLNYEKTGKIAKFFRRLTRIFFNASKNGGPSAIPSGTFATSILQTLKVDTIVREVNAAKVEAFRQRIDEVVDHACQHIDNEPSIPQAIKASLSEAKMNKVLGIIVDEFTHNQLTLNQSFNKMYEQLYRYVQAARENLPESNDHQKIVKRKFLNELNTIREEIYLDKEQAVWLENTQTSVSQVLRAYQELKRANDNPDSVIAQKLVEAKQGAQSLHGKIEQIIQNSGNDDAEEMWDVLNNVPDNLMNSMAAIADQTQAKIEDVEEGIKEFKRGVENWFDNGMQRANGVYKRNSKGFAFILGVVIAVGANVDTFYMVNQLSHDSVLRGMIATQASNVDFESGTPEDREALQNQNGFEIEDLDLPIGWSPDNQSQQALYRLGIKDAKEDQYQTADPTTGEPELKNLDKFSTIQRSWGWVKQGFGWLISGVAISMGAPFWFELLSKVVDIKNTGGGGQSSSSQNTQEQS